MKKQARCLVSAGLVALSVATLGTASTHVHAASSAELEQKTSDLQGELSSLSSQLNTLVTEMDEMSQEAEDLSKSIEEAEVKLDKAQADGEAQYEAMKLRIKYIYEAGDTSLIELLFSAKDMNDFLNKTDFVQTISQYDRDMLNELLDTQNKIKDEGDQLEKKHEELVAKQEELAGKRAEVEKLISSTSGELSNYTAQLERARQAEALQAEQEQQAAQRAAAEAAARQQQAAAAPTPSSTPSSSQNTGGSTASRPNPPAEYTPGSSSGKTNLGNFKITHYCNCYYCTGSWAGGLTASGTVPTAGRTIAVDPSVIPIGSKVIIGGQVYTAEDTGGAIKGNKIDIFVNDHSTALALGVYYTNVYAN